MLPWAAQVFLFGSVNVTRFDQAERSMWHRSGIAVIWREDFVPWKMWCMKLLQVFLNLPELDTCSLPGNKSLTILEERDFFLLHYFFKCEFYTVGKTSHWFHYILHVAGEETWDRAEEGKCSHPRASSKSDLGRLWGDPLPSGNILQFLSAALPSL